MLELGYEMTFAERIEGPLGPTVGAPARLCCQIAEATLAGPRIKASLAMPGTDWIRLDSNGMNRVVRFRSCIRCPSGRSHPVQPATGWAGPGRRGRCRPAR